MSSDLVEARAACDRLLRELRPKLHRYCARMTGSVIDGEDVVQDALVKAPALPAPDQREPGRLAVSDRQCGIDFLRHRARRDATRSDEDPDMVVDPQHHGRRQSPSPVCAPSCGYH